MNFKTRRRLTYVTIAFYLVCGGIEYAVVFPTIWAYLQHLGATDETLLGLAIASFSMSAFLAGPIIGKWFDKTRNAKAALIVSNIFEIVGSLMYFAAVSPWFLVCSRFICGIGSGAGAAILADIAHSTSDQERTPIYSKLNACRQIGLMSGPVFNLLLQQLDFHIWKFPVNAMTSPGLFMVVLGLILEASFVMMYYNLGRMKDFQRLTEHLKHSYDDEINESAIGIVYPTHSTVNSGDDDNINYAEFSNEITVSSSSHCEHHCIADGISARSTQDLQKAMQNLQDKSLDNMIECAEEIIKSCSAQSESISSQVHRESFQTLQIRSFESSEEHDAVRSQEHVEQKLSVDLKSSKMHGFAEEFLRDEVIVLLGTTFISFFAQTSFETIVTPLTQKYYNFGGFENSMLFLFCGIEIFFVYLGIAFLSKKCSDRLLMLIGITCLALALLWFAYYLPRATPGDTSTIHYFTIGVVVDLVGISLLVACSVSLFSKVISKGSQGLGQGLRRSVACAGTIFGPLWGGSVMNHSLILFGVPFGLVCFIMILFVFSYKRLAVQTPVLKTESPVSEHNLSCSERTPLLSKIEEEG